MAAGALVSCWLALLLCASASPAIADSAAAAASAGGRGTTTTGHGRCPKPPLRVFLYQLNPAYNFGILNNRWLSASSITVPSLHPLPYGWSAASASTAAVKLKLARAAKACWRRQRQQTQADQGQQQQTTPCNVTVLSYPSNHRFRQHAAEYFVTMSLLTGLPCVQLVRSASDAEVIFVPFFSSVFYHTSHKHKLGTEQLTRKLVASSLWRRANGSDFFVPSVHPHALAGRWGFMPAARFLSVDFDVPPPLAGSVAKDVVAPYVSVFQSSPYVAAAASASRSGSVPGWALRPLLLAFRGTLDRFNNGGLVRHRLARALKDAGDTVVVMKSGLAGKEWERVSNETEALMRQAKFCLVPEGDTTSSCRLFDAIMTGCVPVVVSDDIELPFEESLDYSRFAVFVPSALAIKRGFLVRHLRGLARDEWERMHARLLQVQHHFRFHLPAMPGGPEGMIWNSLMVRVRGEVRWENRRRRRRKMLAMLRRNGLGVRDWLHRKRGGQ